MTFRTYEFRYSSPPKRDDPYVEDRWFAVGTGKEADRELTPDESEGMAGLQETWTVHTDLEDEAYRVCQVVVTAGPMGWSCPEKYPEGMTPGVWSTSIQCAMVMSPGGSSCVQRIFRPDGEEVDLLRVRFVSDGLVSTVNYPYTQAVMDAERHLLGASMISGHALGRCYSDAFRHARELDPDKTGTGPISDECHDRGAHAAYRAQLAILRVFRCYPIPRYVWNEARKSPYRVEMRWNNTGPWMVVGPKGLPEDT